MPRSSASTSGSSPLTRGKRCRAWLRRVQPRLIPAHAGKTVAACMSMFLSPAHPRSRGENCAKGGHDGQAIGSSPLTRGKPNMRKPRRLCKRLIPAHAGKTSGVVAAQGWVTAHPRSRGENPVGGRSGQQRPGSSPLTRGKPWTQLWAATGRRLIPAHAGKTAPPRTAV